MATHAERERSWAIHLAESGHDPDDVCHGPTIFDLDRAKDELAAERADDRRTAERVRQAVSPRRETYPR